MSKRPETDTAWQRAVRWLAGRDHSAHEMVERLTAAGFSEAVVNSTLRRLVAARYVDDARFASQRAEALRRRGHGSERVRAELTAKGIDELLSEKTVASTFENERELAEQALGKRFPHALRSVAERAKAARFLASRGFPQTVVLAILGEGC